MKLTKQQISYLANKVYQEVVAKKNKIFKKRLAEFKKTGVEKKFKELKSQIKGLEKEMELLGKDYAISVGNDYNGRIQFSCTKQDNNWQLENKIRTELELKVIQAQLNSEGIDVNNLVKELTEKFS